MIKKDKVLDVINNLIKTSECTIDNLKMEKKSLDDEGYEIPSLKAIMEDIIQAKLEIAQEFLGGIKDTQSDINKEMEQ